MRKTYEFFSMLKDEMQDFVQLRASRGLRDYKSLYILESLDKHLIKLEVTEKRLTPALIDGWLAEHSEKLRVNTILSFVNFYAPFARHLNVLGIPAFIPERPIQQRSYVPHIFSQQEIQEIFRVADEMKGRISSAVSRIQIPMLLRLLYGSGLRLGEALRLRLSDFDTENGVLHVMNAKGNMDRLVPLESGLAEMLKKYCDTLFQCENKDRFLFEKEDGSARCAAWVQEYFGRILTAAGIAHPKSLGQSRNICLHCLRHTFAVSSLRLNGAQDIEGIDLTPLLSVYLGHKHLTGTQVYLHMTAENAEDIFKITSVYAKEIFPEVPQT